MRWELAHREAKHRRVPCREGAGRQRQRPGAHTLSARPARLARLGAVPKPSGRARATPGCPCALGRAAAEPRARTHFELLAEDRPLAQGRAVPAPVAELELALVDAHLGPFPDDNDRVGPALADRPLPGGEPRDLVTDDAGSQGHHRGETPATTRHRRWLGAG